MAEINVPAWPIPIQKTKLMMSKAQATGYCFPIRRCLWRPCTHEGQPQEHEIEVQVMAMNRRPAVCVRQGKYLVVETAG